MTATFIPAHGEKMLQCPYNLSHSITNAKFLFHLERCRSDYLNKLSSDDRRRVMKICRFNAAHHVPSPELRCHEERCKDSFTVIRHMAYHNSAEGEKHYEDRRRRDHGREDIKYGDGDRHGQDRYSAGPSSSTRDRYRDDYRGRGNGRGGNRYDERSNVCKVETKPEPQASGNTNEWGLEEEDWEAECAGYEPGYDPEVKLKTELVMYQPQGLKKAERKKFRQEVRDKAINHVPGEKLELPTVSKFETKPDIAQLHIKEEDRSSPLEPGEISDEEDIKPNVTAPNDREPTAERNLGHANYQFQSGPTATNYWQNSSKNSRSSNPRYENLRDYSKEHYPVMEPYADDSDDFEGIDPYPK